MARLIYFIGIKFYTALLSIVALFHRKAALLVQGRKESLSRIRSLELGSKQPGSIWFHFASLGEFEQGQPVMEALRQQFPTRTVIVTFYSPSGYEIRKNTPL